MIKELQNITADEGSAKGQSGLSKSTVTIVIVERDKVE